MLGKLGCFCKDGYYESKGVCERCDPSCLTCCGEGKQLCTKCDQTKNRTLVKGECQCLGGWKEEADTCVKQG
jgi:hypothetical protein